MRLVIADTGPINYLILIGKIDLLSTLFEKIILPTAVQFELADSDAPVIVKEWIANPPAWLQVQSATPVSFDDISLEGIDEGEKAAITLALSLDADLLLMDDRKGVAVALGKGLLVTGTIGILDLAAHRGLVDLADAFTRLRQTNFHCPEAIMDALLRQRLPK